MLREPGICLIRIIKFENVSSLAHGAKASPNDPASAAAAFRRRRRRLKAKLDSTPGSRWSRVKRLALEPISSRLEPHMERNAGSRRHHGQRHESEQHTNKDIQKCATEKPCV